MVSRALVVCAGPGASATRSVIVPPSLQAEVEQGFTKAHVLPLVLRNGPASLLMCLRLYNLQEIRYTDEQP